MRVHRRSAGWLALFTAVSLLMLLLGGCGAEYKEAPRDADVYTANYGDEMTEEEASPMAKTANSEVTRKVIVSANYYLEATRFSDSCAALEALTEACAGYIEHMDVSGETDSIGNGSYTLRIPTEKLGDFEKGLDKVGKVNNRVRNESDITDQYYDVASRIKAKEAQRDRLTALIDKAATLTELLQLESALADVETELDQLKGTQQHYDGKVAYATVTVELWQSGIVRSGNQPYGSRLGEAFTDSFSTALEVIKDLGIAIVWLLPLLLVVGVIVVIILLATRKSRRAHKQARQTGMPYYVPPTVPPAPPAEPKQ